MTELSRLRQGKPGFYPDQAIYAELACRALGLLFNDLSDGAGLLFTVSSPLGARNFGGGRCSYFPQNDATAASLAGDKHFANQLMAHADLPTLGGRIFFVHQRYRAHRPPGQERTDALAYLEELGGTGFIKPLNGSRGDFARTVTSAADLANYLDDVARYYDAVLLQPFVQGEEMRVFVLNGEVLYGARKFPAELIGDGVQTCAALLAQHNALLENHGLSPASLRDPNIATSAPPAVGQGVALQGRTNLSAGGTMTMVTLADDAPAAVLARKAAAALNLKAAGVDIMINVNGDAKALAIIEVNANPSIRFLEQAGRADLIIEIWHQTFISSGLSACLTFRNMALAFPSRALPLS